MGDTVGIPESVAAVLQRVAADEGCVGRTSLHSWIPQRARKRVRRQFVALSVDGAATYVAKVPLASDDSKVAREFSILSELGAVPVSATRALRPADRGFVMRYVPGRDFPDAFRSAGAADRRAMVLAVVEEIARLHGQPGRANGLGVAASYASEFSAAPHVIAALEEAAVGPLHGDLGPWNVRVDDGAFTIIDWEDYRSSHLQALDFLNFVVTLALLVHPADENDFDSLYDQCFERQGPFSDLALAAARRYAAVTGQPGARLFDLLPVFCHYMIARIRAEGRATDGFFFETFLRRSVRQPVAWAHTSS